MNQNPPSGTHLDLILGRVENSVLDAVDARVRRSKRRLHVLVGSLVTVTLLVGTAAALAVVRPWSIEADGGSYELSCLQSDSVGDHPFFGVRFTLDESAGEIRDIDPLALCTQAWAEVVTGSEVSVLRGDDGTLSFGDIGSFDPRGVMTVEQISLDGLDVSGRGSMVPEMAVCARKSGNALFVIVADPGERDLSTEEWMSRCGRNGAFEYWAAR